MIFKFYWIKIGIAAFERSDFLFVNLLVPTGQVGRSPGTFQDVNVKSPSQALRLGLSRLARVKPLHPNAAAH